MRSDPGLNSDLTMTDEKFHHSVYVILLDPVTLGLPSIVRLNPNRDPAKPCVYVGMTGLPVEQRFENHKKGVKAAWVVKNYGIRLIPNSMNTSTRCRSKRQHKWRKIWPRI